MNIAETIAIIGAGGFFLTGLLTGAWKYLQIRSSDHARAHPYVDTAHRTSLMYSFAALLLAKLAEISLLPEGVETIAVMVPLTFFAVAVGSYMLHGLLRDTANQLKPPFSLGRFPLPTWGMPVFMTVLIIGETGGFLVLFYGVLRATVFSG